MRKGSLIGHQEIVQESINQLLFREQDGTRARRTMFPWPSVFAHDSRVKSDHAKQCVQVGEDDLNSPSWFLSLKQLSSRQCAPRATFVRGLLWPDLSSGAGAGPETSLADPPIPRARNARNCVPIVASALIASILISRSSSILNRGQNEFTKLRNIPCNSLPADGVDHRSSDGRIRIVDPAQNQFHRTRTVNQKGSTNGFNTYPGMRMVRAAVTAAAAPG